MSILFLSVLILFLMANTVWAHDDFPDDVTSRCHISASELAIAGCIGLGSSPEDCQGEADLTRYHHGHSYIPKGRVGANAAQHSYWRSAQGEPNSGCLPDPDIADPEPLPPTDTGGGGSTGGGGPADSYDPEAGYLENPTDGGVASGVGVLSGWVCEAKRITIEFNNDRDMRFQAAYGTVRKDTEEICRDTDNGFGLLFNWNHLGDGEHTLKVYVSNRQRGLGGLWAEAEVTVTTLGEEFARSLEGACTAQDFPDNGDTTTAAWVTGLQNFVILDVVKGDGE